MNQCRITKSNLIRSQLSHFKLKIIFHQVKYREDKLQNLSIAEISQKVEEVIADKAVNKRK